MWLLAVTLGNGPSAPSWHAARVSIGLSLVQTLSLSPSFPPSLPPGGHKTGHVEVRRVDWCVWHSLPGSTVVWIGGENVSIFVAANAKVTHWGQRMFGRSVQNRRYVWWFSIKKAFPCSVYSCYGASAAIAFIIDSNYISRWLAHTFILTSVSLINSISMIIEIEFDECYKTWDFRDKYNSFALSFPLIYHILSQTSSLFLTRYFCPCLLTSLSLFPGPPFSLSVCAQLTPSLRQNEGASSTRGACTCE